MTTSDSPAHLSKRAAKQLDLSDTERIDFIRRGSWIEMSHTKDVLGKIKEIMESPRVTRPPCYIFVGDPNSGKSTLLDRFVEKNSPEQDPLASMTIAPVLRIESPKGSDFAAIYSRLLDALNASYKPTAKPEVHLSQLLRLLRTLQTKVILFDEFHNALAGTTKQQGDYRIAMKTITNVAKVNLVCTGIQTALTFFSQDEQFTSRFKPDELPTWSTGDDMGELLDSRA